MDILKVNLRWCRIVPDTPNLALASNFVMQCKIDCHVCGSILVGPHNKQNCHVGKNCFTDNVYKHCQRHNGPRHCFYNLNQEQIWPTDIGAIWWVNLELMQVAFYLAREITQVSDAIPWVRCASGNVYFFYLFYLVLSVFIRFINLSVFRVTRCYRSEVK